MIPLPDDLIREIYAAALATGLAQQQDALLAGLSPSYIAMLPSHGAPATRLLQTLHELNAVSALADGTVPLDVWLGNAVTLAQIRQEGRVFGDALTLLRGPASGRAKNAASVATTGAASSSLDTGSIPPLRIQTAAAVPSQCVRPGTANSAYDRVDVIILTAIPLEYRAALQVEAGAWDATPWRPGNTREGLPLAFRTFVGKGGAPLRIALTQSGEMGMLAAAGTLTPLIEAYAPKCIAMCGVCAGRPVQTGLGDVIAADRLFVQDAGKQLPDKVEQDLQTYILRQDWKVALQHFDVVGRFQDAAWWQARPIPYKWQENWVLAKLSDGVTNLAELSDCSVCCPQWERVIEGLWNAGDVEDGHLAITHQGRARIQRALVLHSNRIPDLSPGGKVLPFKLHVAPMGSGNRVIEDANIWSFVSRHMRKSLGLEMEAAALGALAHMHRSRRLDALVMKGVMDFADHGRDDHFKEFAARASAECLMAFLRDHVDADT